MNYEFGLEKPYAVFSNNDKDKVFDFSLIKAKIEQYTDNIAGNQKNIILDKSIVLNIYSKYCPNLTLIGN